MNTDFAPRLEDYDELASHITRDSHHAEISEQLKRVGLAPPDFHDTVAAAASRTYETGKMGELTAKHGIPPMAILNGSKGRLTHPDLKATAEYHHYWHGGPFTTVYDHDKLRTVSLTDDGAPRQAEKTNNIHHIIRHEYGHHLHDWAGRLSQHDKNEWDDLYHTQINNMPRGYRKDLPVISHYALTNPKEGFAEAFATWANPKLDRSKYAKEPNELFDYMDRKFGQ